MSYHLGVDLGTTFTAAAISRDGTAEMAELGSKTHSIPSVLMIRPDGTTLFGESAHRRARTEPQSVAREFKRRLGDTTPLIVGGSPHSAERLMGRLLAGVVADVSAVQGGPPKEVAVTHPANWGPYRLELLENAIRIADLPGAHLLTEPVAAAIHYSSYERVDPGSTIAVYDLGGGTFDAAVLRKTADGFDQLGESHGIERLGGLDFDAALLTHVMRGVDVNLADLAELDDAPVTSAAVARLREDVTLAKEMLSADSSTTVTVMLPTVSHEVLVTRREFEELIRAPLVESVNVLVSTIESAGLEVDDVTAMLLIGGSSRIPLVAELVASTLNRPVKVDTHPKNSVALGAARHAGLQVTDPAPPAAGVSGDALSATVGVASEPVEASVDVVPAVPEPVTPVETAPSTPPPGAVDHEPRSARISPRLLVGGLIGLMVIAAGVVALLVAGGGDTEPDGLAFDIDGPAVVATIQVGADIREPAATERLIWTPVAGTGTIDVIDTRTLEVVDSIATGDRPRTPLVSGGNVWVSNLGDGTVSVIDATTRDVVATATVGERPFLLTAEGGFIWVPNLEPGTISAVSEETFTEVATIPIGEGMRPPISGEGLVWVSAGPADAVTVIDPTTQQATASVAVGDGPLPGVVGGGFVWVPNHLEGSVSVIDPTALSVVDTVTVGRGPLRPTAGGTAIWVANEDDATVTVIDIANRDVLATIPVGAVPTPPVSANGFVWVSNSESDTVSVIDPNTFEVVETLAVGNRPFAGVPADGLLFVVNVEDGTISVLAVP